MIRVACDCSPDHSYFVRRWQIEVTFAETRAHLGVETQRQWNDKAIMRTTPSLLGLYSLVTLWACDLLGQGARPYSAVWYKKTDFTFSDTIGAVRLTLWDQNIYRHYPPESLLPEARKRPVIIADDAHLIEGARLLRSGTDILFVAPLASCEALSPTPMSSLRSASARGQVAWHRRPLG